MPAVHMNVHLATDVTLFWPLEKLFAIPLVLLTTEDVMLIFNTAMKPYQDVSILVYPA